MQTKLNGMTLVAVFVLLAGADPGYTKNMTVAIPVDDVTARTVDGSTYYVLNLDLPSELTGKRLDSVFLEFVVDVSQVDGPAGNTPSSVAVYPLSASSRGSTLEFETDFPTRQVVSNGEDQAVSVDITDIAKGWLSDPSSNHGLVISSFSSGTITLNASGFGPQAALRVTYFYQNRFGERVSSQ